MSPDKQAPSPVRVGDIVAGKYRIERQLGHGGMGVVMAAHHLALDEPVALKFVLDRGEDDGEAAERLVREARATFRLRSPNAVRVHDVGRMPTGPVYIVMELLEGRDLRSELAARGPLPEKEVVSYALDVCSALDEAHAAGIVHRDLKPHNLFLTKGLHGRPIVKVLDFGLSKLDSQRFEAEPLTQPETALGTPRYMAPEQWRSAAEVDARADVWALGTVMYELSTGKAPLQGLPWEERRARMLAGAIPSPREVRADLSEALARVILRCLRADPAVRWATAAHLAEALRAAVPAVNPKPNLAVSRQTGVTAVVPPEIRALQAAHAFGSPNDTLPAAPPTLPDGPQKRPAAAHVEPQRTKPAQAPARQPRTAQRQAPVHANLDESAGELDSTEVRPPLFTAEDLSAPPPIRVGEERLMATTLSSKAIPPSLAAGLAHVRRQAAALDRGAGAPPLVEAQVASASAPLLLQRRATRAKAVPKVPDTLHSQPSPVVPLARRSPSAFPGVADVVPEAATSAAAPTRKGLPVLVILASAALLLAAAASLWILLNYAAR